MSGVSPTGTVNFMDGTTTLGTGTITGGTATLSATFTTVGVHSLTASYAGDAGNPGSNSAVVSQVVVATAVVYYIRDDHLDTPRAITDTAGNVVWQWDNTDPYGNNVPNENPSNQGQFSFNLRFPGQYFDRETGLNYNRFRDYDPSIGRYVESDPIGLYAGVNTYAYVEGNPLWATDPTGLAVKGGARVPGTTTHIRIDPPAPTWGESQTHAHIYDDNGNQLAVINKDGTGSHGHCPDDVPKNKKVRNYLRERGFRLPGILMIPSLFFEFLEFREEMNMTPQQYYCKEYGVACQTMS